MCINYDRIFDATYISEETLDGSFKPESTLASMIQKIASMNQEKLGKIFVKYEEPIDLTEYIDTFLEQKSGKMDLEEVSMKLTKDLYFVQQKQQPITMNSLISSSLLYDTADEIKFTRAKKITGQIYKYIQSRDYLTYVSTYPQNYDIFHAARNLGLKIEGDALDKYKGNQAKIDMGRSLDSITKLSMAFYAN